MIKVTNINKAFKGNAVLKGIDAEFEKGKTNLIIGASGTGKSVLLKCIVGLVLPDSGSVEFDGRDLVSSDYKAQKGIRRDMGMLFQGSALFDSKTVEENILFPLQMLNPTMNKSEMLDRANFCLKRVGLENRNKLFPSEISGGMQKRVGIARAIVMNPKYLFCDEPNSGLDPQTSILIDELIKEITEEFNTTTVVVTHDMNSVVTIGEHVVFLHKGEKLWQGNKDQIMYSDVKQLNDFIFASELMKKLKALS
jgi:phospholipid/cholesterol/gamma-HCH transport system ATP-binding protein